MQQKIVKEIQGQEEEQKRTITNSTRMFVNRDEIIKEIKRKNNAANKLSICTGFGGMQMSYDFLFDSYKNVVDKSKKKEGLGLRWITNINKDNLELVKIFLKSGIQIRHIKNMPPLSFGVSDKEVALTIDKMEDGNVSQSFLISNEPLYVNHFNSLFEELWKNGVDATDRIRDIEAGVDLADIEVIPSSTKAQDKYLNIVKSASEEILWIFPTTNAFIRQEKIGIIELAKQAAKERNIKVRILVPINSLIEQITIQLIQHYPNHIDVRYIEQMLQAKATVLVVDRRESLVMELGDN
jgi:two-component system, OmpR family, sensor histidine kinase VicK